MTLVQLIPIVLQISIALVVFCMALQTRPGDLSYLLRRPGLLVRCVLAMNVVMPILAAVLAAVCNLRDEVKVALIVLAVSPVPPVLPGKQGKAGGDRSFAIGLLMVAALISIVSVPITVAMIGRAFGHTVAVPMAAIAKTVGISVIGPLIAGALVRMIAPGFAERFAKPISKVSLVLLVLGFIPILIKFWPALYAQIGDFTIVAIVLFTVLGLGVGHLMGGPDPEDRSVLALATAIRHPGVAIAIASAVAADKAAVAAVVLLAALVGGITTIPYVKWRKRGPTAATVQAA